MAVAEVIAAGKVRTMIQELKPSGE